MTDERQVKVYVELGQAALQAGESAELRVWLLARACDIPGRGLIPLEALKAYTQGLFSAQTLMRAVKLGNGRWWTLSHNMLALKGFIPVANRYELFYSRHPVYLPIGCFKRIGDFRSAMLAAMMAQHNTPISQAALSGLYGCSLRSVSSWTKRASRQGLLTIQHNAVLTDLKPDAGNHPLMAELGYYIVRVGGVPYVARRLPNSYSAERLPTAPFGKVKVAKKLNASSTTCGATFRRLYFTEPSRGYFRAVQSMIHGESVYLADTATSDDDKHLWRCCEKQHDQLVELWPI